MVAFADALDDMLASPADIDRMGARAREVRDRFSLDRIVGMWDTVIAELVQGERR